MAGIFGNSNIGYGQQPNTGYFQQPMLGQGSSMFGSFFGAQGTINQQSIENIRQQLTASNIPVDKIESITGALSNMIYEKDEQVTEILTRILGDKWAKEVQLKAALDDLEEDLEGEGMETRGMGPGMRPGMGTRGMGTRGMGTRGMGQGMGQGMGPYLRGMGGSRRRRTRRRMQRGGYSMSTFSNNAASFSGGRRKSRRHRRSHKKHGKRSHRR